MGPPNEWGEAAGRPVVLHTLCGAPIHAMIPRARPDFHVVQKINQLFSITWNNFVIQTLIRF